MDKKVRLTIDGRDIEVQEGSTVLEAARALDINIPTLCFLKGVNNPGSCRMCIVDIEGYAHSVPSCNTKVREGMVVTTDSDKLRQKREFMLKLILADHDVKCLSCRKSGSCELQDLAGEFDLVDEVQYKKSLPRLEPAESSPFLSYYPELCIGCLRCVNMCNNIVGNGALKKAAIGSRTVVKTPFGKNWKESGCESCGNCAAVCPTGALITNSNIKYQPSGVRKVLTTCPHCGAGCQIYLVVKDDKIVDVIPADGPVNKGLLCVKGRFASYRFVHSEERLKYPMIKNKESGEFERASWDEALDLIASKFMQIKKEHGADALAAFACSRASNEDCYMLQKMARCAFGTNNVDNCARVCHSATVTGLAKTLGSGAMTNPVADITEGVDAILLVGSNPEEAHPVIGMRIRRAVREGAKLIVVDPRNIGLTDMADIHIKLNPGSNVAWANAMMHIIIRDGLYDRKFVEERTEGFEEIKELVKDYTPELAARICGIDPDKLTEAAHIYAKADKAPIIYCLGVTEHSSGTEGVMSVSNLAMLTGKLGRSGCGVNPLRGQNNVQGACDMGALPDNLPGYQKLNDDAVISKFESSWNTELNRKPGIKATDVFGAAIRKDIRGLFIFGEDPVVTDADQGHIKKALESLDFLVICDLFMTESCKYADVVLPGRSYAEKEGTFTNTERRVQRVRKAVEIPGQARADTDIFIDLMNRMGYPQPYIDPSQVMDEIASLTPSYAGISHARLDAGESLAWPCTGKDHPGTPILHVGKFSRGKGSFYPAAYVPAAESADEEYPVVMMTGRMLYHYNAAAMTARTPGIMEKAGHSYIEINSRDAEALGIRDGELIKVSSRRGTIKTTADVSEKVLPGQAWMPFHFSDGYANVLTHAALDELARIPEYKVCAVKIEKI